MGQSQSFQSASIPSKEEILKRTKGGSSLVNELFQWMVSQANIRDFYLMANPAQCKKYIMLTADVLNKVFYKIDYLPQAGPQGSIYFRKVDALNPQDKSDPLYKHREINCLRLAFLFVRIFQVFAALSLTILDVEPKEEKQLLQDITKLQQRETIPLFAQKAGALDPKKHFLPSSFEVLRGSLAEIPTNPSYYKFMGVPIYIEYGTQDSQGRLPIKYDYSSMKNGRRERRTIEGKVFVERRGPDGITIVLSDLIQYMGSESKTLFQGEPININFNRPSIEGSYVDRYGKLIPDGLHAIFIKMAGGEEVMKNKNKEVSFANKSRGPMYKKFEEDMGEVAEGLHTKTIVSAFARATPPKAHCISRALQLVSEGGLQSQFPKQIYSRLCDTKFMVDTHSLPPANERITKEDGIYALGQLFYDTLREATPFISQATETQYQNFLTKMKFVFEESKDAKVSLKGPKNPLDTVINKLPTAVCDSKTIDKKLETSNHEVIRLVRDNVRKMVSYQINHTANVVKILRKLFLLPIESGKALQIHPRVLKYGIEEVNKIAEEARNLLIDYYSQCEILYRSGAEIIGSNKSLMTATNIR